MNSVIDGRNLWKYKDQSKMESNQSLCAQADRVSVVLGNKFKLEELSHQNSNSTAEEDPIIQIH